RPRPWVRCSSEPSTRFVRRHHTDRSPMVPDRAPCRLAAAAAPCAAVDACRNPADPGRFREQSCYRSCMPDVPDRPDVAPTGADEPTDAGNRHDGDIGDNGETSLTALVTPVAPVASRSRVRIHPVVEVFAAYGWRMLLIAAVGVA